MLNPFFRLPALLTEVFPVASFVIDCLVIHPILPVICNNLEQQFWLFGLTEPDFDLFASKADVFAQRRRKFLVEYFAKYLQVVGTTLVQLHCDANFKAARLS